MQIKLANSKYFETKQYVASIRLTGTLNIECAVLPNGNNNTAITDDVIDKIILTFDLSIAMIIFHGYVVIARLLTLNYIYLFIYLFNYLIFIYF